MQSRLEESLILLFQIHIYNDGLARFCTVPYEAPTNKNIHKTYMHLTNYSLNKRSETYKHTETDYDGSKRTVSSVIKTLEEMGSVNVTANQACAVLSVSCLCHLYR